MDGGNWLVSFPPVILALKQASLASITEFLTQQTGLATLLLIEI